MRGFLRESVLANLAEKLTFRTVVFVEIYFRGITTGAFADVRDITFRPPLYRFDGFVIVLIPPLKVLHKVKVIPWLNM